VKWFISHNGIKCFDVAAGKPFISFGLVVGNVIKASLFNYHIDTLKKR